MTLIKDAIFVGHSHLQALRVAANNRESITQNSSTIKSHFIYIDSNNPYTSPLVNISSSGKDTLNASLASSLYQTGAFNSQKNRTLVSVLSGNLHSAMGLIQQEKPYDIILPGFEHLPLIEGAEIIPIDVFLSFFRKKYQPFFNFINAAKAETGINEIYWLESPPPIPDEKRILNNLDLWFKNNYPQEALKIAPVSLRFKLWKTVTMMLEMACAENDYIFVPVPSSVQDIDGNMTPDGWWSDATHGSPWYGEQVLRNLYALMSEKAD